MSRIGNVTRSDVEWSRQWERSRPSSKLRLENRGDLFDPVVVNVRGSTFWRRKVFELTLVAVVLGHGLVLKKVRFASWSTAGKRGPVRPSNT
jgi:hypothetical protein